MSLTPITTEPKRKKVAVYDLEWFPSTYKLRVAGTFDGERYRSFLTIGGLLNYILQPAHEDTLWYAHAGGLADMHFLLEKLHTRQDIRVRAAFSGSSAIVVRATWQARTYTFLDSFWLLRDKLAHLAPFTGLQKTRGSYRCIDFPACGHVGRVCDTAPSCGCEVGPEPLCMFEAPIAELTAYNEQDCRILHAAIDGMQTMLLELGTELRATVASTALGLFRQKYLSQRITTDASRNDRMRAGYWASRVEPIRPRLPRGTPGRYYDINSSFPFAATHALPGEYIGQSRRVPKGDALYFAEATVKVPDMFLPPLAAHGKDGRTFFPTGKWRALFSRIDLDLLEEAGGTIERVHEVTSFQPFHDLAEFALDLYQRRLRAKKEGKPFLALVLKFLLNTGCYGKFAERREKEELVMHPAGELCPHDGKHNVTRDEVTNATCVEPLFPGCILVTDEKQVAHEHVAIASYVTSIARRTLYRHMAACGEDLYYCDTDSIVTCSELPTGDKLGDLKLEFEVREGYFPQPKLYELTVVDKDKGQEKTLVKSKGFSRLSRAQFADLVAGRVVEVERMYRVKEYAREHKTFGPAGKSFDKRIRLGASRPKREILERQNSSRPWTYREIQERWEP
jgi:hypothetical protein